jgi:hypothetical protein
MYRPTKKPTTWAEIDAALARAEVNGAERALVMAKPIGQPNIGSVPVREFERGIEILRGEADDYAETMRRNG